jgi:hypothetical protein
MLWAILEGVSEELIQILEVTTYGEERSFTPIPLAYSENLEI